MFFPHWVILAPSSGITWQYTRKFISGLYSIHYMSIFMSVPHCFKYSTFIKRFGVKILWFLSHRSFYIVTNFPKSDSLVLRSSSSQLVDEEEMWTAADEACMCLNDTLLVRQCYAWSAAAGTPLLIENKDVLSRNRKALSRPISLLTAA